MPAKPKKNETTAPAQGATPEAPAAAPAKKSKPKTGQCAVVLKREAALGNGTRKKGEVLCSIERGKGGHLDFDSAVAADGVEQVELDTAFNNLHLLDVVAPGAGAAE